MLFLGNAILDLYALLFEKYFRGIAIKITMSQIVLRAFSHLPPVIRHNVWSHLYEKEPNNVIVVDKLCLSIIKCFDKSTAYQWLEDNKDAIKSIPFPPRSEIQEYYKANAFEVKPGKWFVRVSLYFDNFDDMYELLKSKIDSKSTSVNEAGKFYGNFEQALLHYENFRNGLTNLSQEEKRFLDLTDFVFIGRMTVDNA